MKVLTTRSGLLATGATILLLWLALPGGGGLWPLLAVACVPLLVCVCRGTRLQALGFGFLAGFGHFLLQLYWIVFVLGHYGGLPLIFSVPALLLLVCYMAASVMAFSLLAQLFVRRFPAGLSLWLLPCAWVGVDWLRSFLFSGFPWMDLGYGLAGLPVLLQSADIWGHYGLTFLLVLLNSLLALLIINREGRRGALRLMVPVCLLLAMVAVYSGERWQQLQSGVLERESLVVAVVQGNVDQSQKWLPARQQETVLDYIEQSRQLMHALPRPDLVIWPETALPFYPLAHPLLEPLQRFVSQEQVMLLTGAPWYEQKSDSQREMKFFNSSLLFDSTGEIVARTSKTHLVPFGEYVPLKRFLSFLEPLVEAVGDFSPGKIHAPPACQKASIGVLVCFESIFPDISRKWVDAGATLLVNMTNDAWYGRSSAPHQTLAMTRLRAVETRRSVVRSANTGFSAFIDPLGRLQQLSPLFVHWGAGERVEIMAERTLFVRGGYLFAPACFVLTIFGGGGVLLRRWAGERKG
ncbi:MAG: apolipoprotein N-acyltransferase [Proteobacteria bacterium]|nr:apolipoprotein N-acyltransferase [Pseudomonadota bacterium]MBU1057294.1 apolipoprotein N-acyltransferase [Pseudomonadota bacterium]